MRGVQSFNTHLQIIYNKGSAWLDHSMYSGTKNTPVLIDESTICGSPG